METDKIHFVSTLRLSVILPCILLGLLGPSGRAAQPTDGKMTFLVARSKIGDPFFERSVVLMLPDAGSVTAGLIINKSNPVAVGKLFPKSAALANRTVTAYFGGPVDVRVPSLLFRSSAASKHSIPIYGDVYLTFDTRSIVGLLKSSPPSSLRLFLGRAQWGYGQLQNEIRMGAWYKMRERGDVVFSLSPQSLWRKLHDEAALGKYIEYQLPSGTRGNTPSILECASEATPFDTAATGCTWAPPGSNPTKDFGN